PVTDYSYNHGKTADQFTQLEVYGPTRSAMDIVYDTNYATVNTPAACRGQTPAGTLETPPLGASTTSFSVKVNYVASITIKLPTGGGLSFEARVTYIANV